MVRLERRAEVISGDFNGQVLAQMRVWFRFTGKPSFFQMAPATQLTGNSTGKRKHALVED
jgi:hypothetical protein